MRPIRYGEHVFVAGMTGSGKTFLAARYLEVYAHVVVLDTKGMFDEWKYMGKDELTVVDRLRDVPKARTGKIIYRPVFQELAHDYYDEFFAWVYKRKNTHVLVDEAMQISPSPGVLPEWCRGCLQRGRQRKISVWGLSQRPKSISPLFMSEATHIFAFRLSLEQDRQKLVDITQKEEFMKKPEKYRFWYFNAVRDDGAIVKGQIKYA